MRAPKEPSGKENWLRDPWVTASPSARQIVCILQRILSKSACVDSKYAAILAVAFRPIKCRQSGLRPSSGHPRATLGRPRSRKQLFKKASQLRRLFFGTFLPSTTWSRDTVNMQRICLASLFEATSAFSDFWQKCARVLFCTFRRGHGTP